MSRFSSSFVLEYVDVDMASDAQQAIFGFTKAWLPAPRAFYLRYRAKDDMSSKTDDLNKTAMAEFLRLEDYKEFWKAVKQDLHSRILAEE